MTADPNKPLSYADSGVSIDAGDDFVRRLAANNPAIGGFAGLFPLDVSGMRQPVLVAGTDGVGTKLLLARRLNKLDTVGIDLVAMVVNDLLVPGARPLFFLDYYATGELRAEAADAIVGGILRGCELAGIPLIGGETAEMPGLYRDGEFDLAGFGIGVLDGANAPMDGSRVASGQVALGLASSGVHSNGFSLVRAIVDRAGLDLAVVPEGLDRTLGEALLEPTRIYAKAIGALLNTGADVRAMCHITGGGLPGNLPRVIPGALRIEWEPWAVPALFAVLQAAGSVADDEMARVFNCGIGYVVVVPEAEAAEAQGVLEAAGERVIAHGVVVPAG